MDLRGLRGKMALVTGATGCIGGRLAERLAVEEGVRVRAVVRDPARAERLRALPVEIVQGDLLDMDSLHRAARGCNLVFHSAAIVRETGDPNTFYRTNVEGTRNMIEAAAGVEKFVHISSVAVYGTNPPDGADEDTPFQRCGNLYCDTKIGAEEVVWERGRTVGLPVVVIRPANVFGPHSNPWTVRPVQLLTRGRMILIDGGLGLSNYVYVDNLVDATLEATKRDQAVGRAYLISDGDSITWKEFFGHYARMFGRRIPSVPRGLAHAVALGMEMASKVTGKPPDLTRAMVTFLSCRARFSNDRAQRELDFRPRISIEEGMRRTEAWLREEGYLPSATAVR